MSGNVFKRKEIKYILEKKQYEDLMGELLTHMKVDSYGLSKILNIYLDTDDYRLIRTSLEKPKYKEKLRLRSYGIPGDDSIVFLELKKKYAGVVYKRRISMKAKEAMDYIYGSSVPEAIESTQIGKEIDHVMKLYRPKPRYFIGYDRIAMYGRSDPELRITFDFRLRYRKRRLDLREGDLGELLSGDDSVLMEIKAEGAYPIWLTRMLSKYRIYPSSFSKYGAIYQAEYDENMREIASLSGMEKDIFAGNGGRRGAEGAYAGEGGRRKTAGSAASYYAGYVTG